MICAKCDARWLPNWSYDRPDGSRAGMRWEEFKLDNGDWDAERCASTVRYECPKCGHGHPDNARTKDLWNRCGRYTLTTAENRKVVGYRWRDQIDARWEPLVIEYLQARNAARRGNLKPTVQFFQKRQAEHKSESSAAESAQTFAIEVSTGAEWPEEAFRFMTIDRQMDHYWFQIRAVALSGRTRRIAHGKAFSFAELDLLRDKHKVRTQHTACDSGFEAGGPNGVYAACVKYGWRAFKGENTQRTFTHEIKRHKQPARHIQRSYSQAIPMDPGRGTTAQGRAGAALLVMFCSDALADVLQGLIDTGYWTEPPDDGGPEEREYRKQMASERKTPKENRASGRDKWTWRQIGKRPNHQLDCSKMMVLFFMLAGVVADQLEEAVEKEVGEAAVK